MMKIFLCLIALIPISVVVFLTYTKMGAFIFAGGSDSVLRVVRSNIWITVIISLGFMLYSVYIIYLPKFGLAELMILVILFVAWCISGRAFGVYPDGRIISGWYFLPTAVIDFRDHKENPEFYVARTKVQFKSDWVLKIESGERRTRVFVGPLLHKPLLRLLNENGFNLGDGEENGSGSKVP